MTFPDQLVNIQLTENTERVVIQVKTTTEKTTRMPEYYDEDPVETSEEEDPDSHTIPSLFPTRLLDSCLSKVQEMIFTTGVRAEAEAREELEELREAK